MPNALTATGREDPALTGNGPVGMLVPMAGMVESLNVASCAAILLFEVARQRAASGAPHAHSADELEAIHAHLRESNGRLAEEQLAPAAPAASAKKTRR